MKKMKKAGFQFVGWCMIYIVSKNHTQIRKIERGIANLPLWQWLGWPCSYCFVVVVDIVSIQGLRKGACRHTCSG